jgi:hypothetical protein
MLASNGLHGVISHKIELSRQETDDIPFEVHTESVYKNR